MTEQIVWIERIEWTCCYPADRCPEVPQLKMATADGWLATIGSVVTYTCQKGYRSSGQSAKPQTVCDGQRWSAVSSTCEGLSVICIDWLICVIILQNFNCTIFMTYLTGALSVSHQVRDSVFRQNAPSMCIRTSIGLHAFGSLVDSSLSFRKIVGSIPALAAT